MTNHTVIYHNPRCSKSRQTLQLLEQQGVQPRIIEYLKTPPDRTELERILKLLGKSPRELMRTREAEYKTSGADDPALSDDELIDIMLEHPKLIERPIVVTATGAAIGRPPEAVLEIIDQ
ncbi:arsenate reductase (glutaredoxin) [Thiohalobacter thiocyanaticus]|uniref:Arsenate reductase n=1 Tax=Thiohalobacter thiocyanaticus TaxID=585455 RepID=A0A426QHH4_9GAMM|nr:arsenate reductase (glutaredoxin) [Thiohalobacter thiocyanaticus]RRQ21209.1 arsenate reductase (glutaredoxin) [Thiohalobacter thiocyanaticus]